MEALWRSLNADSISSLPPNQRAQLLEKASEATAGFILESWYFWARDEQRPPNGRWRTWLYLGGRGAGKTRAGAGWIEDGVRSRRFRRIALVGATFNDARAVMVEGVSGLMAATQGATYEPSNHRVCWSNGAIATILSAEEPDSIRGHQFDAAWGDVQAKLNKAASGDTASLLYQTGYSGRAEFGLTGDDNFHCKVSPDGAAWTAALTIDKSTGAALFTAGIAGAPSVAVGESGTGFHLPATGNLGIDLGGAQTGVIGPNGISIGSTVLSNGLSVQNTGTTGAQVAMISEATTGANFRRFSNNTNALQFTIAKGRGTIASPALPNQNDQCGSVIFAGVDSGSVARQSASVQGIVIETSPSSSAMGGRLVFATSPLGSVSPAEVARVESATGLSMFGANPVIDQNRGHRLRSTTIAGAITPSVAGTLFYHSDAQGGAGEVAVDTGSAYRHAGQAAVKKLTSNADATYTPRADGRIVRDTATLTADRKLVLAATNVTDGHKIELSRRGSSGGFNRAVTQADGTTLIASIADNTSADFIYDATAALWFQK